MTYRKAFLFFILTTSSHTLAEPVFHSLEPGVNELPTTIRFDCAYDLSTNKRTVSVFDRILTVPRHFSASRTDETWYNWDARLGEGEDAVIFAYASINYGTYGAEISIFDDWDSVSVPSANNLSVDIRYKTADQSKGFDWYVALYLKDGAFLKVQSAVPIDWLSLLNCFE